MNKRSRTIPQPQVLVCLRKRHFWECQIISAVHISATMTSITELSNFSVLIWKEDDKIDIALNQMGRNNGWTRSQGQFHNLKYQYDSLSLRPKGISLRCLHTIEFKNLKTLQLPKIRHVFSFNWYVGNSRFCWISLRTYTFLKDHTTYHPTVEASMFSFSFSRWIYVIMWSNYNYHSSLWKVRTSSNEHIVFVY